HALVPAALGPPRARRTSHPPPARASRAVPDPARLAARAADVLPDQGHECAHRGSEPDRQNHQAGRTRVPQPSELPMPHHWLRAPTDRGVNTQSATLKVEEPSTLSRKAARP